MYINSHATITPTAILKKLHSSKMKSSNPAEGITKKIAKKTTTQSNP